LGITRAQEAPTNATSGWDITPIELRMLRLNTPTTFPFNAIENTAT